MGESADQTSDDTPEPLAEASGHWSVFLPALVIAVIYGGVWGHLALRGSNDGALGRLLLAICVIGVPVLLVHAFLRYTSTRVEIHADGMRVEQGWPKRSSRRLEAGKIVDVETRFSPLGRLLGGGVLVVHCQGGHHYAVADLAAPDRVAGIIRRTYDLKGRT